LLATRQVLGRYSYAFTRRSAAAGAPLEGCECTQLKERPCSRPLRGKRKNGQVECRRRPVTTSILCAEAAVAAGTGRDTRQRGLCSARGPVRGSRSRLMAQDILEMFVAPGHARIFCEDGVVYLADFGKPQRERPSNRAAIVQNARAGFAMAIEVLLRRRAFLSRRDRLWQKGHRGRPAEGFSLTLTPASSAAGSSAYRHQPVFPFSREQRATRRFSLVRATSTAGSWSFLSRPAMAHIFQKDGGAFIEDLDSSNGTFVDGAAPAGARGVPLEDGNAACFSAESISPTG